MMAFVKARLCEFARVWHVRIFAVVLLLIACFPALAASPASYNLSLLPVGTFIGQSASAYATGVNDRGDVVFQTGPSFCCFFGATFLYSGGKIYPFSIDQADQGMSVAGINDNGIVVGGYCSSKLGTRLPPPGGVINACPGYITNVDAIRLGTPLDCGSFVPNKPNNPSQPCTSFLYYQDNYITNPTGINNNGDIIGFWEDATDANDHAFIKGGGGASPFGSGFTSFDGPLTMANPHTLCCTYPAAINDVGQIVGNSGLGGSGLKQSVNFVRAADGGLVVGPPTNSALYTGINALGTIVVVNFGPSPFISLLTQNTVVPIDTTSLGNVGVGAVFIANSGIIAGAVAVGSSSQPFIGIPKPGCVIGNVLAIRNGTTVPPGIPGQCFGRHNQPPQPPHWGGEQYAKSGKTICALGCYLTSLSIALMSAGINWLPDCFDVKQTNDPGHLNDFMTCKDAVDRYAGNAVNPFTTTSDVSDHLMSMGLLTNPLIFQKSPEPHIGSLTSQAAPFVNGRDTLDGILCGRGGTDSAAKQSGFPIVPSPAIVKVMHCRSGLCGPHFVLAYGQDGEDYLIADPSGFGPSGNGFQHLSDFTNDANALQLTGGAAAYFEIKGYVMDPTDDVSALNFSLGEGDTADILVSDSAGRRTGPGGFQIPESVYFADSIFDDDENDPPLNTTTGRIVNIFQPGDGAYQVDVRGLKPGQYTVGIRAYSQDGSAQAPVVMVGITGPGADSIFNVQFSSSLGAIPQVARIASFASTLADVRNSFQSGLIDNAGLVNSLISKVSVAADAANRRQTSTAANLLKAFTNEVEAQAGKHITGVAPQVLLEDASWLIGGLH